MGPASEIPQVPVNVLVSKESFGLPDGGVPPQSMAPPPVAMPPLQAVVNAPTLTQPLDLSSLEGLGAVNVVKPSEPPLPTSVRLGQVDKFFFLKFFII